MDQNFASLLALLDPDQAGFRLTLTPAPRASRFPFASAPGAGPLAHLVSASVTCGSSEVSPLVLLVQKDSGSPPSNGMSELTNIHLERLWQACRQYHQSANPANMIDLSVANEHFRPFQALFHCRSQEVFFHPPCPACGRQLRLCTDDDLLENSGLPGYGTSLRRFMYCPHCAGQGAGTVFYCRQLEGGEPENVLDCNELIKSWQALAAKKDPAALPCQDCQKARNCFGPSREAAANLAPFSFYPFYLLAFKDLHLNLKDFLPLLAGGPLEAEKTAWPGRQTRVQAADSLLQDRRLFIFSRPERLWLEILHLKLCLLEQIVSQVEQAGKTLATGLSPWSIESFWIRLAPPAAGLPLMWQFEPVLVDLAGKPVAHGLEKNLAAFHRRQFLAGAWFYVLLANSNQKAEQVMAALEELVPAMGRDKTVFDPHQVSGWNPVFQPGQIFWDPQPVKPEGENATYWARALELGLDLLRAGLGQSAGFDSGEFLGRLNLLTRQIRQALLSGSAESGTAAQVQPEKSAPAPQVQDGRQREDKALASLLGRIRQRWATTEPDQDGDWQETVVLSRAGTETAASFTAATGEPDGGLEKTVVMQPQAPAEPAGPELEKTVVLDKDPVREPADHLAETVVLGAGDKGRPAAGQEQELEKTVALGRKAGGQDDAGLEKTVVLGKGQAPEPPADRPEAPRPPSLPPEGDDDLEATLVLKPGKTDADNKGGK